MAITPTVQNLQSMEVGIKGPNGADTMYVVTGLARAQISAANGQTSKENFSLHVGPTLTTGQYRRSIASASLAHIQFFDFNASQADHMAWEVEEVDADFDDENDQVELRYTVEVRAAASSRTDIVSVAFTVMIVAKMDED